MKGVRQLVTGFVLAAAGTVAVLSMSPLASAESRECGDNAIIRCGAMSASELKSEYAKNDRGLKKIYDYYGISAGDIAASGAAKIGQVHTNGEVTVNGKVVATNAQTVGRSGALGGKKINANGVIVYQGPDRLKSTLSAFVFFNADGSFKSAAIKVCGNPVKATPKPVNKPGITITKTVNGVEHVTVPVGQTFTYEIVVTNTGNVALKNAVVTDTAPREVTLVSASAGTINGQVWTYTIPSLAVKASATFKITAKYVAYASGAHINNVCVDTPTVPGAPDACDTASTGTGETPVTPPELPHTGVADVLGGGIGVAGLVAATGYYVASRRSLR